MMTKVHMAGYQGERFVSSCSNPLLFYSRPSIGRMGWPTPSFSLEWRNEQLWFADHFDDKNVVVFFLSILCSEIRTQLLAETIDIFAEMLSKHRENCGCLT